MKKITLENGTVIEISEKSYKALQGGVADEFPRCGDTYYYVENNGEIDYYDYKDDETDREFIACGNFFKTREGAETHALKIDSITKGFKPEEDEDFWIWDFEDKKPHDSCSYDVWAMNVKLRTKEDCQAWYDKYGKAWE